MLADPPDNAPPPKMVVVAPRLPEVYVDALDSIADRLGMTRTGLAAQLLELAIAESGQLVGVEILPDPDTGEEIVGLFDDPREKE